MKKRVLKLAAVITVGIAAVTSIVIYRNKQDEWG